MGDGSEPSGPPVCRRVRAARTKNVALRSRRAGEHPPFRCYLNTSPSYQSKKGSRRVQVHSDANQRLQRLPVDLLALVDVDGAPGVALETGVEETCGVRQGGALGEGQLHRILVRLAGADDS